MAIVVRVISWMCLLFMITVMTCKLSYAARMLESASAASDGSVRVLVRVLFDGCFEQHIAKKGTFLPASSIVSEHGEFFIEVPNEILRSKEIQSEFCFARILSSPHTSCNVSDSLGSTAPAAAPLVLKSRKGQKHVYITGPFVCSPPLARTSRAATSTIKPRPFDQSETTLESHAKAPSVKRTISNAKSRSLDKHSKRTKPSFSFPFAPPFQLPSPPFQLPPGGLTSPLPFVQPSPPTLPQLPPFFQPPPQLPLFPFPSPPSAGFLPSPGFPFLGQPPPSLT
ncbi:hypothetical protein O6H91_06G077500 [Diphasiastrum complanatum]|uniref:Uncharacterized protein n=1 Tax=Diphasiastrum complanatum TaxID=34168 RepID=A0ACC2DFI7_DIPCM|nr:hypothetical protein O6H91_06G077500 [Diphasiastrum complanatum]